MLLSISYFIILYHFVCSLYGDTFFGAFSIEVPTDNEEDGTQQQRKKDREREKERDGPNKVFRRKLVENIKQYN